MGDIKIYDIENATRLGNIDYFVETGTLHGDSIEYVRNNSKPLKKYISFEVMKSLSKKAADRFKDDSRVEIIHGDSAELLSNTIKDLDGNILFWLDAHFPGADVGERIYGDESDPNRNLPLRSEISAIKERAGKYHDIIIIDDLWIYEDGDYEWGTFDSHMETHGYSLRREDLKCGNAEFIRKAFNSTHSIKKITKYQGSLIITPRV